MPARQSLELIWRHRRILVGAVVGCLAVAAMLALAADRRYESRTQFLVSTAGTAEDAATAYEAELFSQQRVTTYAEIVSSPQLLERVAQELRLPGAAAELEGRVTASVVPETALVDVTASADSAAGAKTIADALSAALPRFVQELERPAAGEPSPVRMAVTRDAEVPTAAASPDVRLLLVLGLFAGLVVGAAAVALAAALDDRARSVEALERLAGAPVLGSVAEDGHGGPPVLLDDPLSPRAEDYRRVRAQLDARWRQAPLSPLSPLVVTSLAPQGGTGAIAANLGVALAQGGLRVALLDANPGAANLSDVLGLRPAPGLADVLAEGVALEAALAGVGELPLTVLGAGTPRGTAADALGAPRLPAVIAALGEHADVVIVDAPPLARGADAAALAPVASAVLLVVGLDTAAAADVKSAAQALEGSELGVVVNRRAGRRSPGRKTLDGAVGQPPPAAAEGATHAAGRA